MPVPQKLEMAHRTTLAVVLLIALSVPVQAQARDRSSLRRALRASGTIVLRASGFALGLALHEACHIGAGKAMGARVRLGDPSGIYQIPTLLFGGLSEREDRIVAAAGNGCTAIAAEAIVRSRLHRRSNIAWGLALFHAWNAAGYAFAENGDAEYWEHNGGSVRGWQLAHTLHAARIGNALATDAGFEVIQLGAPVWGIDHRWEYDRSKINLPALTAPSPLIRTTDFSCADRHRVAPFVKPLPHSLCRVRVR